MSPNTLQDDSLAFRREAFFDAEANADAALEELADFCCRVTLWGELTEAIRADLERLANQAEQVRREARDRLALEFSYFLRANSPEATGHE